MKETGIPDLTCDFAGNSLPATEIAPSKAEVSSAAAPLSLLLLHPLYFPLGIPPPLLQMLAGLYPAPLCCSYFHCCILHPLHVRFCIR
jgi:hypothetical protein